jgi:NADH-quinone oxidoreductase subunit G
LAGNDQHISLTESGPGASQAPELIVPANDNLFTSGTLGRYSKALSAVLESHQHKTEGSEVAAD